MLVLCGLLAAILTVTAWAEHADTDIPYAVTGGNIWFDASAGSVTDCDHNVTAAIIPQTIEGATVKEIGSKAFQDCSMLKQIQLPDTITRIRHNAFCYCDNLNSVTIPGSVTHMAEGVFQYSDIRHANFAEGIRKISGYTFYDCKGLQSVFLPVSVTTISGYAFYGCSDLTDIYYAGTQELWRSIEINESGNEPLSAATVHYGSVGPEDPGTTPPPEVSLSVPSFGAKLPLSITGNGTRTVNFVAVFYDANRRFIGAEFLRTDIYPGLQSVFVPVSRISVPALSAFALDENYRPLATSEQNEISGSEFPDKYAAILSEANSDSRNALIDALTEQEAKDFVRRFAGWMR